MRIPDSVTRAYEEELALIEPLRTHAGNRLRVLAANNHWLFDDRIKSAESCLSKLEAGHSSLRGMRDFYAAMLVVPTQKYVDAASRAILDAFNGEVKAARTAEASSFVYDDLHVIATLRGKISPRAVPHPAVLDRPFEIQIHTGVQYAWWRSTHDDLYKGSNPSSRSWAAKRASGQARASLELIDAVLADFEVAAQLQRHVPQEAHPGETIRDWTRHWRKARRPKDEIRFVATVSAIAKASEIGLDDIASRLSGGGLDRFLSDQDITPIQVILVCCHLIAGDAIFGRLLAAQRQILITDELVTAYPPLGAVPTELRVEL